VGCYGAISEAHHDHNKWYTFQGPQQQQVLYHRQPDLRSETSRSCASQAEFFSPQGSRASWPHRHTPTPSGCETRARPRPARSKLLSLSMGRPRRAAFGGKQASSPTTKWCSRLTGCIPTAQCRASKFPVLQGPQPADLTTDRHSSLRNIRSGGRGAVHARQQGHRFHCQGNLCDVGQFQYIQPIGCTGFWLATGPLGFLVDANSCSDLGFRFQRAPVRHQTFTAAQHGICPAMV
jgi:hypothetical protein